MDALVPTDDGFDFSKYQAGDVICIPMSEVRRRGQAESTLIVMHIANAASRAGLDWTVDRDNANDELRVSFK